MDKKLEKIFDLKLDASDRDTERHGLIQYDYGQILRIHGLDLPPAVEIQFSYREKGGTTENRVGTTKDGITEVQIPDKMLKNNGTTQDYAIWVFVYVTDETSGNTVYRIKLYVDSRPAPGKIGEDSDEPHPFDEAVNAVNAAASRAENALKETKEIQDNLNIDLSEKITRPAKAEVGQVLAVKETDESGKPTTFEAQDVKVPTKTSELENDSGFLTEHQDISGKLDKKKLPEAIDTALAQAKESGAFDGKDGVNGKDGAPGEQGPKGEPGETTYIENPYDDTELKSEIATKITAPENPEVGKVFKIKSVNDDGTFIGEWADCANLDVQIDGESIIHDNTAGIPPASYTRKGVVYLAGTNNGLCFANSNGLLALQAAPQKRIDSRTYTQPIVPVNLDYAVKAAMTDGKGVPWTADEQEAARERMGAYRRDYRLIADITLEQESPTLVVTKDADGKDISLGKAKIFVFSPAPRENSKNNGYVLLNDQASYYGVIDWKVNEKNSVTVVNIDIFGGIAPATVKFVPAHNPGIAVTKTVSMSVGNKLKYYNEINKIVILANYYFDKGTRFIIIGKE